MTLESVDVEQKPTAGKIVLYFLFAWIFTGVCTLSATFTAAIFISPEAVNGFSFLAVAIGFLLAIIRYGAGAFVLGTLVRHYMNRWLAAFIYFAPFLIVGLLALVAAVLSSAFGLLPIFDSTFQGIMSTVYMIIGLPITYYSISYGVNMSGNFIRPGSVLNIPWQHWLWILPTFLFQIVGVPLFLFGALIYVDILITPVEFFLFNISSFLPRLVIVAVLYGVIALINVVYSLLTSYSESSMLKFIKVAGSWLMLTIIQLVLVVFYFAQTL